MPCSKRTKSCLETPRASLPQLGQGIAHLADMAEVLRKMSQDLLRQSEELEQRVTQAGGASGAAMSSKGAEGTKGAKNAQEGGETRSLYLSPQALADERALFQECGVDNLFDLLGFICDSMFGTVLLMRNLDHEAELPGFAVQLLGESLEKHLDLLQRARSYCGDMEQVETSGV